MIVCILRIKTVGNNNSTKIIEKKKELEKRNYEKNWKK